MNGKEIQVTTLPIEQINVALSAGAVATAAVVASPLFALSVAVGAFLESISFRGLSVVSKAFFTGSVRGSVGWLLLLAMRLGLVGVLLYFAVRLGADPVGLLIGLSVILPASVIGAFQMRPTFDPEAAPLSEEEPVDWGWDAGLYRDRDEES